MNGRLNSVTIGFTSAFTRPKIAATTRIVSSLALEPVGVLAQVDAVDSGPVRRPTGRCR